MPAKRLKPLPYDFDVPPSVIYNAHVGDLISLTDNKGRTRRWKVNKKANFTLAVEPYCWYHKVEEWLLEQAGKLLP